MTDTPKHLNPWQPMTDPVDLAVLGKLGEELNEAGSAAARCIIQGIDEAEPTTGKINKQWLEDELADVWACTLIAIRRFGLDGVRLTERTNAKIRHLEAWHALILPSPVGEREAAQPQGEGDESAKRVIDALFPLLDGDHANAQFWREVTARVASELENIA